MRAVDYVLKPFTNARLLESLDRARDATLARDLTVECENKLSDTQVPFLILQPIVENALGLANTRERLKARYGETASFSLTVDPAGNGSLAEICLPVQYSA